MPTISLLNTPLFSKYELSIFQTGDDFTSTWRSKIAVASKECVYREGEEAFMGAIRFMTRQIHSYFPNDYQLLLLREIIPMLLPLFFYNSWSSHSNEIRDRYGIDKICSIFASFTNRQGGKSTFLAELLLAIAIYVPPRENECLRIGVLATQRATAKLILTAIIDKIIPHADNLSHVKQDSKNKVDHFIIDAVKIVCRKEDLMEFWRGNRKVAEIQAYATGAGNVSQFLVDRRCCRCDLSIISFYFRYVSLSVFSFYFFLLFFPSIFSFYFLLLSSSIVFYFPFSFLFLYILPFYLYICIERNIAA